MSTKKIINTTPVDISDATGAKGIYATSRTGYVKFAIGATTDKTSFHLEQKIFVPAGNKVWAWSDNGEAILDVSLVWV